MLKRFGECPLRGNNSDLEVSKNFYVRISGKYAIEVLLRFLLGVSAFSGMKVPPWACQMNACTQEFSMDTSP